MTKKLSMPVDSNTTLVIMGGNYTLDHGINVSNTKYFSMLAANNSTTIITCTGAAAYFTLSKIFQVYISGLTFIGCGNNTVMFVHHLIIENTKSFGERSNGTFLIIDHSSAELTKTFISNTSGKLEKHNIDRYLTYLQTISSANYQRYGSITLGGAIISTYSNLSIENCKFNGNKANIGGAILSDLESSINISNSEFTSNEATGCNEVYICFGLGGALFIGGNSTVIVHNSTFYNNTSGVDGGVAGVFHANLFVFQSHAYNNRAINNGGVVATFVGSYVYMDNTTINNNIANCNGGAIANTENTISLFNHCNFSYNSAGTTASTPIKSTIKADGNGGVVYAEYNTSVVVNATTLINNSATGKGGVFHVQKQSHLAINNCTILNSNAASGGVLFATDSTSVSSWNSYLEGNVADSDGGVAFLDNLSNIRITNSILNKNKAQYSGGVICAQKNSWITISGTTFTSNKANTFGGVIRMVLHSSVLINDSRFDGNYAGSNGGVFDCFHAASMKVYRSKFKSNTAQFRGGVLIMTNKNDNGNSKDSGARTVNNSEVVDCTFTTNLATNGGVFVLQRKINMSIQNSLFNNNTAKSDGSVLYVLARCSITIYNSSFNGNMAINNGILLASYYTVITIYDSRFGNNSAGFNGGAVYVSDNCITTIKDCNFTRNQANDSGGTIYGRKSNLITINSSTFNQSIALNSGGVIHVQGNSTVLINDSNFTHNAADYGGVVRAYSISTAKITRCYFKKNQASIAGGVMAAYKSSTLAVEDSLFFENIANIGGVSAMFQTILPGYVVSNARTIEGSKLVINTSVFHKNSADLGGVLYVQGSTATISDSNLDWNTARFSGGAISANTKSKVTIKMNNISHNTAKKRGGVMSLTDQSDAIIEYCTFSSNNARTKGGVLSIQESNVLIFNSTFRSSSVAGGCGGAIYTSNSSLHVEYSSFLENNVSSDGGAVHVEWNTTLVTVCCIFTNNTAKDNGGALFFDNNSQGTIVHCMLQHNAADTGGALAVLSSSSINIKNCCSIGEEIFNHHNMTQIQSNTAGTSGGGIYLSQSNLHFRAQSNIYYNQADKFGGGIHAIESSIEFRGSIQFDNNRAEFGGGISLTHSDLYDDKFFQSAVSFAFNKAFSGGALYVDDFYFCSGDHKWQKTYGCFFQNVSKVFVINFSNNSANFTGEDLYGGHLDRCLIESDYDTNYTEDSITRWKEISNLTDLSTVSSQPARVCHCKSFEPHCDERTSSIQIKQGEKFKISVVVVDQVKQPVETLVLSTINQSGDAFSQTRVFHWSNVSCHDLEYNVSFSNPGDTYELMIDVGNTSCEDVPFSKITVLVSVINCSCAPGFMSASIRGVCYCVCDKQDTTFSKYIQTCIYENLTVIREGIFWITYFNDSDNNGYLFFPYCPLEYCQPPGVSVPVNLSQPNGSDAQCTGNRVGLLCGSCPHNYSLSLGSAKCIVCPENWHGLLIVIVLAAFFAGIALVLLLLVFNLTVAVGTLNSIIFYANIIYANKSLYFGHSRFMLIQVITSWLNLDIGFDACFFDGLDTYVKVWLQLAFPMYIIALIIVIIVVSSCSSKFSHLIGRKDPVATLATLILLSYTKLLQIIITSSSYVKVEYPNGMSTIRWIRDANIEFGTRKSIVLICVALIILIFGLLYTFFVLFWQCLVKCPRSRLFGWTRNHKLYSFINTYHTPHTAKHRFWPGLLLLIRVAVYLIAAFSASSDQPITLLSTVVIMCCLLFYKAHSGIRVYRNWLLNAMESFVYFNITVFAVFTMFTFISSTIGPGNKESFQRVVANLSIGSVLLLILFVIIYHVYRYGSTKVHTLVESTSLCRLLKAYNQNRNHWKQLDNPLLDVIDDPRDESDDIHYTSSSLVLPTSSTVSFTDAGGTSVTMTALDHSTKEGLNPFQDQESKLIPLLEESQ